MALQEKKAQPKKKEVVKKESTTKKKALPKKSSKELTIDTPKKAKEPIVRPIPKKAKPLGKEEKALYNQLAESFTYIMNLGMVIEDRTMDRKQIPDLAIGELHVIETVNKNNNKPMSLIAKKEHVTVGALTICVNRLVQKGYLLRTRDEMDQRVIKLSVTPKAKKVLKFHDQFHETIIGLALENTALATAAKVMTTFATTLEVYDDPSLLVAKTKKRK